MLLYACLGNTIDGSTFRRVCTIGSAGRIALRYRWMKPLLLLPRWALPSLRLRLSSRATAFIATIVRTPLHGLVCNPHNLHPRFTKVAMVNLVEDIPAALGADFLEWMRTDVEITVNGESALARVRDASAPALFFAGKADQLAPAHAVEAVYEAWGASTSTRKEYILLSKDNGHAANYGHGDMAVGPHVIEDIFQPIERFLAEV